MPDAMTEEQAVRLAQKLDGKGPWAEAWQALKEAVWNFLKGQWGDLRTNFTDHVAAALAARSIMADARDKLAPQTEAEMAAFLATPEASKAAYSMAGNRALSFGLYGEKGVSFQDGESRIVQALAKINTDPRTAIGLVSRESEKPDAYASAGRPIPPYSEQANVGDIIAEEGRLIQRAKAEGFFWDGEKTARIIAVLGGKGGGSEHDVYFAGTAVNPIVIRSTILDSYGFKFRSPAQYLKRLED